jgi:ABC-type transport system substrate-binding protein
MQRQIIDDVAFVPLYRLDELWVYPDWLHGVTLSVNGPFWDVYAWSISES